MVGYNIGTRGYRTEGGSSERETYRVGKKYEIVRGDERDDLYKKLRNTGIEYEREESRMQTLKRIAFAPKLDIGRG